MLDLMFRGSRAPWGLRRPLRREWLRSRWRQTPSQTGPNAARSGGFGFSEPICFGDSPEQRFSDKSSAKIAGPVLPGAPFAFGHGAAQLRALDTSIAWRREGPERIEKFFIHSLLHWGLPVRRGGLASVVWAAARWRNGGAQQRTRTYVSWNCTAMVASNRCSTRTQALRIPT